MNSLSFCFSVNVLIFPFTDTCHHARLIFEFLVEMGFHRVGQAGLELLTSGDSPAAASQSAGITGVSHHAPYIFLYFLEDLQYCFKVFWKYSF